MNGFLLSGCPGCHLGEKEQDVILNTPGCRLSCKNKALGEDLVSRNRLLSVDYYLFPY